MRTQWMWASTGTGCRRVGLNYPALEPVMRHCGVRKRARADVFTGLRIMEDAALEQMNG